MTSGLRWPLCGNLSGHESRGPWRVSSWGCYTNVTNTHDLFWSSNEKRHAHSDTRPQTHQDFLKKLRPVAGENVQICDSHTATLWIIELSCSSWSTLWCARSECLTCQTVDYTHIHGFKLPLACSWNLSRWASPRLLALFLVVLKCAASMGFSTSQIKHILITAHSICSASYYQSVIQTKWVWWWGWTSILYYYLFHDFILNYDGVWAIICRTLLMSHHSGCMTQ